MVFVCVLLCLTVFDFDLLCLSVFHCISLCSALVTVFDCVLLYLIVFCCIVFSCTELRSLVFDCVWMFFVQPGSTLFYLFDCIWVCSAMFRCVWLSLALFDSFSVVFDCFHPVYFYLQLYSIVFHLVYSVPQYLICWNMLHCLEQYVLEFIGSNLINKTCMVPQLRLTYSKAPSGLKTNRVKNCILDILIYGPSGQTAACSKFFSQSCH